MPAIGARAVQRIDELVTDVFTRTDLEFLMHQHEPPCVTICMPLHRVTSGHPNQTLLKNLLRKAQDMMVEAGHRRTLAREVLEPAWKLLAEGTCWRNRSDGLAMFASPDFFRCYRLPIKFRELVTVTGQFHIRPLLPLFLGDGLFYLLALSLDKVRLFRCTRRRVTELSLPAVPRSLEEFLRFDQAEQHIQCHTRAASAAGKRAVTFHAQGTSSDEAVHKKQILEFFKKLDNGVRKILADRRDPLLLAGVSHLRSLYGKANLYPFLLERGVEGSPERLTARELHEQAWPVIAPHFERALADADRRFELAAGTRYASADLEKILPHAYLGQVELMFVEQGVRKWGRYEPTGNRLAVHDREELGDEDLLDYAAMHVLLHGGEVFEVPRERMPAESPVAAVFRR